MSSVDAGRDSAYMQPRSKLMVRLSTALAAMSPLIALAPVAVRAQDPVEAARRWVDSRADEITTELRDLLTLPNVAADGPNIRRNADTLVGSARSRSWRRPPVRLFGWCSNG